MPIKLLVTHAGDDGSPDEYVFDQDVVTIGRDGENPLTLPDPARVLSKRHAEIRARDGGHYLTDLGSKNFTYLNGARLPSDQPALLNPGDSFTLGDFEVRFYPHVVSAPQDDRTVFAASFANPFDEVAGQLAASLGDLRRVWGTESGVHRMDALRDALNAAMIGGGDEPGTIVAELLGGGTLQGKKPTATQEAVASPAPEDLLSDAPLASTTPAPSPAESPVPKPTAHPFAVTQVEPMMPPVLPPPVASPASPPDIPPPAPPAGEAFQAIPPPSASPPPMATPPPSQTAPEGQVDRVLDVLIEIVSRLVSIPWQFRHEFIGQTIVQTDEAAFLYETPPAELKALLLNPSDPAEAERRIAVMLDAAEAVVVHQLALLDGYKASVQEGAGRLLERVAPGPLEEEIEASSPVYKVPQLRSVAVLDRLKEIHHELGGEDWSVAERRAFRPAFIKAYLARMTRRRA